MKETGGTSFLNNLTQHCVFKTVQLSLQSDSAVFSSTVVLSLHVKLKPYLEVGGLLHRSSAQRLDGVQTGPRAAAQSAPSRALQVRGAAAYVAEGAGR